MRKDFKCSVPIAILVFILVITISCIPISKLKYFNDIDELQEPIVNPREQKLIIPFDKLNIKVFSIDEKTNELFNSKTQIDIGSTSTDGGYLVDEAGNINYIFTGKVNVKGLTPEQAGIKLGKALSEYVPGATVSINFISGSVTLLGEVGSPGMHSFSQDKLNIYEALALGGGISQYGNREKVILIRQEGDKIMHHKLNLTDSRIAETSNYYIQANDVIVVEPIKSKSWYSFNSQTYTFFMGTISTLMTFFTFFIFLRQ